MSRSHASRHARRVPSSTGCVRRCVGVARAAREGLPPLGDGLRTPRRASKRASSATKAPQRSPRGARPSSPPPRPGGTRTERRRTRPQPLKAARAVDAARDLFVRGFRPMKTQLLLDSTPPRRVQTRSQPQILGQDPRQLPPPSRNPELPGYRRRGSRNSFSVTPPLAFDFMDSRIRGRGSRWWFSPGAEVRARRAGPGLFISSVLLTTRARRLAWVSVRNFR